MQNATTTTIAQRLVAVLTAVAMLATLLMVSEPAGAADGDLEPNFTTIDMFNIRADSEGRSKSRNVVVLTNTGTTQDITVNSATANTGTHASMFTVQPFSPTTIGPGEKFNFWVQFAPTSAGTKTANLTINHNGNASPLILDLQGIGVTSDIWYRINAGGNFRQGTVAWVRESPTAPSPYLNATEIGNTVRPPGTITSSDGTVPSSSPIALFETHRYDPPGGDVMAWDFPVDSGSYEVRLYFAETENLAVGQRVFDVLLEGEVVLSDFDIVAQAGAATGTMRAFIVTATDGKIDLDFGRITQNPLISAIEIIERSETPAPPGPPAPVGELSALGASPTTLTFSDTEVGSSSSATVTLTNQGAANDTAVTLSSSITGSGSPSFSITGGSDEVTLAPGDSVEVTVQFAPNVSGARSASLVIDHDGANSPLEVALSGTATSTGTGFIDIGNSVFQTEINWLAATGITRGCNPPVNDRFCPTDVVTRGQMAAFLHRALDGILTPGAAIEFIDDDTSVFEADIEWLAATGVTRGCNPPTNNRFCPDDPVTRGQMAAFLHRALDDVLTPGAAVEFIDDDTSVFEADIEWLAATGVTRGCNPPTNDRFCPDDPVTREQMAAFLYRALR